MMTFKKRILLFAAIFFGVVMCSVAIAICGGATFGTYNFGWLVGTGMIMGGVIGAMASTLTH